MCTILATALQSLKQSVSQKLIGHHGRFWQTRYYDFNVRSEEKRVEKLKYIHRNPVKRGLVEKPEDWEWSSYRHYATGIDGVVEIESPMAAWRRRQTFLPLDAAPTLSAKCADKGGGTQIQTLMYNLNAKGRATRQLRHGI